MKFFRGLAVSAGLVLCATAANAQTPHQIGGPAYTPVSDVADPYEGMPRQGMMPGYGYGPAIMPPVEVYAILRETGFSPLGPPQQRGFFYSVAVVDRVGEDGRLVIDGRNGRIVRFTPAYEIRNPYAAYGYGPPQAGPVEALPPMANLRGVPRPPASVPHVASRPPMPKPSPLATRPVEPEQRSASIAAKPAEAPTPPPAVTPAEPKPAPQIAPTQAMPKVQGLE
jgi:hypothetical protein